MKQRLLTLLLTLIGLTTTASAENYNVKIGGKYVTSDNYTNITAAGDFTAVHQNPPSLSTMLKCAGRFFYIMSNRIPFQKPYTSAHDLVWLLQSRGLTVIDTAKAESYLEYIGYYRLSAYIYPLLQMPKEYGWQLDNFAHRYASNIL